MAVITPIHPTTDTRVTHESATVNGRKYHYVNGHPKGREQKGVALLVHGFPDLWYGWRYTIPALLDQGLRVVVPDMLGYGGTDAPEEVEPYAFKSVCNDLAALLDRINVPKVVVIGHDWGSLIAQRMYFYHPHLITNIAAICVPFSAPTRYNLSLEQLVERFPNFRYQIAFAGPELEKQVNTKEAIGKFLNALHQKTNPKKGAVLPMNNKDADILTVLGNPLRTANFTEEDWEFYKQEFARNGMKGPFNWYRTRSLAYQDEHELPLKQIPVPSLFIGATYDGALPPAMWVGQEAFVPNLTQRKVDTGHWAMVEDAEGVNAHLVEWVQGVVFGGKPKL